MDLNEDGWTQNGGGFFVHHKFGFGILDAQKIIEVARNWTNVGTEAVYSSNSIKENTVLIQRTSENVFTHEVNTSEFDSLEHVVVIVWLDHPKRGAISLQLISPFGTVSNIAPSRPLDPSATGYQSWSFMSVRHWGENPNGVWTFKVIDKSTTTTQGKLVAWELVLHGVTNGEPKQPSPVQYTVYIIALGASALVLCCFLLISFIGLFIFDKCRKRRKQNYRIQLESVELISSNGNGNEEDDDGFESESIIDEFDFESSEELLREEDQINVI